MASADMTRGKTGKEKESRGSKKIGRAGRRGKAELANKQTKEKKAPSLFISVTFAFSALALLHAKQGASAAEGEKKGKRRSDGNSNWPESVSNVCIHGHTRQTGVGTRSAEEGH